MIAALLTVGRTVISQAKWLQIISFTAPNFSNFYKIRPYMIEKRDFFIGASITGAFFLCYLLVNDNSWIRRIISKLIRPWIRVGYVKTLFIHPIKSCRGVEFDEAEATEIGLKNGEHQDRVFVVMDTKTGSFVSSRPRPNDHPKLVLIETQIARDILSLSAYTMGRSAQVNLKDVVKGKVAQIKLWRDRPIDGYDCGDEVADWLAEYLDVIPGQYRLLYYRPNLFNSRLIREDEKYHFVIDKSRDDKAIFSDLTPYVLATESTLDDLNTKLVKKVTMRHFRPNIVVGGTDPYDEHNWIEVKVGESAEFMNIKPCGRCLSTTVDPDTGEVDKNTEPLSTLRKYCSPPPEDRPLFGNNPYFGINLVLNSDAETIRVGDPVYVSYK